MYTFIIKPVQAGKAALSGLVLFALLLTPAVKADQTCLTCRIGVLFQGVYSDETCKVVINNATQSETVTLPKISIASLRDDGSEGGSRNFDIALKECPADRRISLVFKGNLYGADTLTGNLINAAGDPHSKNVQIRLRKENGTQIKIGDINTAQDYLIPPSGAEVKHDFTASYYAKGRNAVTAGLVKTAATIDLIYN